MKKMFMLIAALTILSVAFGFSIGSTSARSAYPRVPVAVLTHPLFNNLDGGTYIPASVNDMSMGCYTTSNHKVRCVAPKVFAGERVTIKITIDGTHLNFSVKVPEVVEVLHDR